MFGIRKTLRAGAVVFGGSAALLILTPGFFLDLLALDGASAEMKWSMRMIGITLIALSGNMWANANSSNDSRVRFVATIMFIAASALGALTLLIPAELTWFTISYSIVGFGFGLNYLICLTRRNH